MARQSKDFRDFGLLPEGVGPPAGTVRAFLSTGHIIGQYIAMGLLAFFGLGIGLLFALTLPFPINLLVAPVGPALAVCVIYLVTRHDYSWIELDGETLRAKHLYTRRLVVRHIEDIEDLLTLVLQIRNLTTRIAEAWLGRVRGVEIRFQDRRTPLRVSRTDPAMMNAQELIEAVLFRMSEKGPIQPEITDVHGKPLVRRIHWRDQ